MNLAHPQNRSKAFTDGNGVPLKFRLQPNLRNELREELEEEIKVDVI